MRLHIVSGDQQSHVLHLGLSCFQLCASTLLVETFLLEALERLMKCFQLCASTLLVETWAFCGQRHFTNDCVSNYAPPHC